MDGKQTKSGEIANVSKSMATSSLLLLRPRGNQNTDKTAKVLAACEGVQHVSLSSGEFGFVVSTRSNGAGLDQVKKRIRSALKGADMVTVVNHYVYSRARRLRRRLKPS